METAKLAGLARRMRVYAFNMASALAFFTYGMVIAGVCLAYFGLALRFEPLSFAAIVAGSFIVATIAFHKLMPRPAKSERPSHEGLRWFLGFLLGFAAAYAALGALAEVQPGLGAAFATAWYLGLALSFLAIHAAWERWFIKRRLFVAPAFLVTGAAMAITYPVVAWTSLAEGIMASEVTAIGLVLLCYYLGGAYALLKANEALFERMEAC